MLDAAVCGAVFASPNVLQIENGLDIIHSPKGMLVIVKNYTGDRLNFGLAVEKSRAAGSNVRMLAVGDDVAIGRSRGKMVGRRGMAGTALIHKIAGAAAEEGMSLDEVFNIAEFAAESVATIGAGLNGCDVPGQQRHIDLEDNEVELGMGIHNEPGSRRIKPQPSTPDLIKEMLSLILNTDDTERSYLPHAPATGKPTEVVLLINNLGGLSVLELTCLTNLVLEGLQQGYNIKPCRVYSGTFLSALNATGFSITLLSMPVGAKSEKVLSFLDAPTTAPGWTASIPSVSWNTEVEVAIAPKKVVASVSTAHSVKCE